MARITLTLWTCGRCGKPRGLHHACAGRRKGRDRFRLAVAVTCPSCGKAVPSLLAHSCGNAGDFRRRMAAQERREQAAERQRKHRERAARRRARQRERQRQTAEQRKQARDGAAEARRKAAQPASHDRERHEYAECADPHCSRYPCRVFREGREAGWALGHAEGVAEGYAEGMTAALSQ